MKYVSVISLFLLIWSGNALYADDRLDFDIEFHRAEIPFYTFAEYTPQVALRMGYAQFEVDNVNEWLALSDSNTAYEIDLVFTKYPEDIRRWRTDYFKLLNDRLDGRIACVPIEGDALCVFLPVGNTEQVDHILTFPVINNGYFHFSSAR